MAKFASGLFYCWYLLHNNNAVINLQTFTSIYGSKDFSSCDQGSHCGILPSRSALFSRPGCLGLIMKNRGKSTFCEVINSSATSMCLVWVARVEVCRRWWSFILRRQRTRTQSLIGDWSTSDHSNRSWTNVAGPCFLLRIDPASEKLGITSLSAVVQWVSCRTMMNALFL